MTIDYGPCSPWPVYWSCDVSASSPAATGYAVNMASRVLWALSGRKFGLCDMTWRLCRPNCYGGSPLSDTWFGNVPGYGYGTLDSLWPGWYPVVCGNCNGDSCSCSTVSEIRLPSPVSSVTAVKIDGSVLSASAYRLYNHRILVRADNQLWPRCNDMSKDDTQAGTWSVEVQGGEPVPDGGRLAAGELACEILKAMRGEECRLPAGVTQLVRQGVTISVPDFGDILMHGRTGLYLCDMFIMSENPKHLQQRARTWSVDGPRPRRAT